VSVLFRLNLLSGYTLGKRDFDFSMIDLIKGLLKLPCTILSPRVITKIVESDEYMVVHLSATSLPLYWPKKLPIYHLYMVITEAFYQQDWHHYEVRETQISLEDVVLDCGAAEGLFSLRAVDRASRLVLFEPSPMFASSLSMTFAGVSKVTIVPAALSDAPGKAFMNNDSIASRIVSYEQNTEGTAVEMTTIDKWVTEKNVKVDFIKGDLEGYEMDVLRGAAETIRKYKPKIALTTYHPGNDWKEMLAFCRSLSPRYRYRLKGFSCLEKGLNRPVMIHLWHGGN
jgi:FkbM family methyltransferase